MKPLLKMLFNPKGRTFFLSIVTALLAVLTFTLVCFYFGADNLGATVGKTTGTLVGTAIGSIDGLVNGSQEGEKAGLSAQDTTVNIQDSMGELGNLEVLVVGVTLRNVNRIGERYAKLSLINGDAVFSVDMTQAEINFSQDGKEMYIKIPEPKLALYLDQSGTQTLAEIQDPSFAVTAEDGLMSYLNSMAQTVQQAREMIVNYDSLMEQARESAQRQVQQLIETVCGNQYKVYTEF